MIDTASLVYEPLNEYKPVGPDIGIVDGPLEYLTVVGVRLPLPFSTRMTVVRLKNGDLFLHSPIAFDTTLAGRLQSMGTIRHLVSPNQFHYAHMGEWSEVFPDAVAHSDDHDRRFRRIATTCSDRSRPGPARVLRRRWIIVVMSVFCG